MNEVLADALADATGTRPDAEVSFHPNRRWRIDLAYPDQNLAIEVDGSRHLRHKQQRSDMEKANAMIEQGWIVLRYPASSVLAKTRLVKIVEQVNRVLCGVTDDDASGCVLTN